MAIEASEQQSGGGPQVKTGNVVSSAMDKTVVVAVSSTTMHRLYHRQMKQTSKFYAHDEKNECRVGDQVQIVSSRPMSKKKRWRVEAILKRAEGS
jgi:small subunit ribosomal protein S17